MDSKKAVYVPRHKNHIDLRRKKASWSHNPKSS